MRDRVRSGAGYAGDEARPGQARPDVLGWTRSLAVLCAVGGGRGVCVCSQSCVESGVNAHVVEGPSGLLAV